MTRPPARRRSHRLWLRHLCRSLALVAQLLVAFVPLAEGHERQQLSAHVETPRSVPHPGHEVVACPACALAGLHLRAEEHVSLGELLLHVKAPRPELVRVGAARGRAFTHSSRAPPLSA